MLQRLRPPAPIAIVPAAVVLLVWLAGAPAVAQDKAEVNKKSPLTMAPGAQTMPDAYKLNMLIRTTLIAVNQANQTGNYSVLRDLGTMQFQSMNTDARLAEIFAGVRARNVDMSPILFFDPQLVREPAIENGLLRLTGRIPTKPQSILFDMGFERVADRWMLSAIVIDMQAAPPEGARKDAPAAAQAEAKNDAKSKPKTKPKAPAESP